ncbi:helix-turn-helix domain-containing protein [Enterococcus malodoratus]|uniref:helix-turn-helix domain-containing protein n=1 Tax=Enterococcus malodoratus TaxID=71451 RepID=UPI003FD1C587
MYYPIQLPFLLNEEFTRVMNYQEKIIPESSDFILCFWEISSKMNEPTEVKNVIIADGCIDLIVDYDQKMIFFTGNQQTDFDYEIQTPAHFFGARMMPGAFHQLTEIPANEVMDEFLLLSDIFADLDHDEFFSMSFPEAQEKFQTYLVGKFAEKHPNEFTQLFPRMSETIPQTTEDLYELLHFSPRQCQRLFSKNFGLTPKMVLSILRFQKCLQILTSEQAKPADILAVTNYYDQPHFNRDFKHHLGITPLELVARYKN